MVLSKFLVGFNYFGDMWICSVKAAVKFPRAFLLFKSTCPETKSKFSLAPKTEKGKRHSISISLTNLGIKTPLIKRVSNLSKITVVIKYYRSMDAQVIRIKFFQLSIITKNVMEILL